jgi:hypothetical protein
MVARAGFFGGLVLLAACAKSDPADLSQVSPDAGPPVGYQECNDVYFGAYLRSCDGFNSCPGVLQCDLTRTFAQTAHCHARQCNVASECTAAFKDLCQGHDFHYECIRANPIDPTECRLVEGSAPPP